MEQTGSCPRCGTPRLVSLPLAGVGEDYYCESCDRSFTRGDVRYSI